MREIKFRAWTGKAMEYEVGVSKHGHFYCTPNPTDSACLITTFYPKEVPIMQFTGLHDKNGKEIYEGDIMTDWQEVPKIITFWRGCFVAIENTNYENGKIISEGRYWCEELFPWIDEKSEVIGDVYNNPELLDIKE